MSIKSVAAVQPQPDAASYGFDVLGLFVRQTRATFTTQFGEQPPPYNPANQIQRWMDSNAAMLDPNGTYLDPITGLIPFYWVPDPVVGGKVTKVNIVITNGQAASINVPGAFAYPKVVLQPSGIYVPILDNTNTVVQKQYIPADKLSSRQDALTLIAQLQAVNIPVGNDPVETVFAGSFAFKADLDPTTQQPTDTRSVWNISVGGVLQNVGLLMESQNAQGLGAPGHWTVANASAPIPGSVSWVSDIPVDTSAQDTRPEVPIPMRNLLPNERFAAGGGLGNISTVIQRTDNAATVALDDGALMPTRVREMHQRIMASTMLAV